MTTPFDEFIDDIKKRRFHNHRLELHSDVVSRGILRDLIKSCDGFRADLDSGKIRYWMNVVAPGDRGRKIDLFIGEPAADGNGPDLEKARIVIENKSVVTAHRNRTNPFDDLKKALESIHGVKKEAIIIATILVGLAERFLNIPDQVKKRYKYQVAKFEKKILPRLSSGDQSLWKEFNWAISMNRTDDPRTTVEHFQKLPRRNSAYTHEVGYDYVLVVPVYIDNVNPPEIPRPNSLNIDLDREYQAMLEVICKAYMARWHL
jgi:hypothetical protein